MTWPPRTSCLRDNFAQNYAILLSIDNAFLRVSFLLVFFFVWGERWRESCSPSCTRTFVSQQWRLELAPRRRWPTAEKIAINRRRNGSRGRVIHVSKCECWLLFHLIVCRVRFGGFDLYLLFMFINFFYSKNFINVCIINIWFIW